MQSRTDEEAAERERAHRERVSAEQEHRGEPDEDPFGARSPPAAGREGESSDRGHPTRRSDDAECKWRPHSLPVLDHVEDSLLLRGREVACGSHREPGADPGNGVVRAEEDEEDSDPEARHPGVRASVAVRQREHGQREHPVSTSWMTWNPANHVATSIRACAFSSGWG